MSSLHALLLGDVEGDGDGLGVGAAKARPAVSTATV